MPNRVILLIVFLILSLSCLAATELDIEELLETMLAKTQPVDGSSFEIFLERLKAEHSVQVLSYLAYRAGKGVNPFADEGLLSLSEGLHGYLPVPDLNGGVVISLGYKTFHDSYPIFAAFLKNQSMQPKYLDSSDFLQELKNMAEREDAPNTEQIIDELVSSTTPQVILMPNLALAAAIGIPIYRRYEERSRSSEAQTALNTIRKVYNVYLMTNGSTQGFTIDQALRDARLGESTLRRWKFKVSGNPPRMYIATSTAEFPGGAGLQVWYDVNEACFHGYGVDGLKLR